MLGKLFLTPLKKHKFATFLILIGSLSWSLTMVRSGLIFEFGAGFWGPNGHDGIWHIALIRQLAQGSLQMPVFAGEGLQNYHIGFDLLVAILHRLTTIPVINLYFQILPPLMATSIGILVYKFVSTWQNKNAAIWSLFFVYFGGSLGWLVSFVRSQSFYGESMFWSQQSISTLINPPFALSLIILLLGLTTLQKYLEGNTKKHGVLSLILFGLLIEIKAYAGVLTLGALLLTAIFRFVRTKEQDLIFIFLGSALLSLLVFLPLNQASGSLLVLRPFWFMETMMGLSDRFGWQRFYEAMLAYKNGSFWLKAVPAYLVAFIIFILGNFGTRLISVLHLIKVAKNYKKIEEINIFLVSVLVAGVVTPMLFLQQGTPWNTIQFFYYSLFIAAIYAGISMQYLYKYLRVLIIILTIPTSLATLNYHYLTSTPPAQVPHYELEALEFLEQKPRGIVLTYPFDEKAAEKAIAPRPLRQYVSTAYVSAYTGKLVYLEDEVNLDITSYDWKTRRQGVERFYKSLDHDFVYNFLRQNNIKYLYWVGSERAALGETQLGLRQVFDNRRVKVYEVQ